MVKHKATRLKMIKSWMNPNYNWFHFKSNQFNVSSFKRSYYFTDFELKDKIAVYNKNGGLLYVKQINILERTDYYIIFKRVEDVL